MGRGSSSPGWSSDELRRRVEGFLEERFGIPPRVLEELELWETGGGIWAIRRSPHLGALGALRPQAVGMRVLRRMKGGWKPTSCALQAWGRWISRNALALSGEQLRRFLQGEPQRIGAREGVTPGYVAVRLPEGPVLGCGLYTAGGTLYCQIPRERRRSLRL